MVSPSSQSGGHPYKLFKPRYGSTTRRNFFAERATNVWNFLPSIGTVLLTFHNWPLLDVPFRMLILQIFLNVVCIDLWLCLLFCQFFLMHLCYPDTL